MRNFAPHVWTNARVAVDCRQCSRGRDRPNSRPSVRPTSSVDSYPSSICALALARPPRAGPACVCVLRIYGKLHCVRAYAVQGFICAGSSSINIHVWNCRGNEPFLDPRPSVSPPPRRTSRNLRQIHRGRPATSCTYICATTRWRRPRWPRRPRRLALARMASRQSGRQAGTPIPIVKVASHSPSPTPASPPRPHPERP